MKTAAKNDSAAGEIQPPSIWAEGRKRWPLESGFADEVVEGERVEYYVRY